MQYFRTHEPLAPHTTFKTGGAAEYYAVTSTETELRAALAEASAAGLPVTILGGGSNVLVSDVGVSGCVIHNQLVGRTYDVTGDTVFATYGAGEMFDAIVAESVAHGYWGLENLSHIPGSVGATPIQNVGAYGVEVADRIERVTAIHQTTGEERVFNQAACQFAYRDSYFKTAAGREWVVTMVTYRLSTLPKPVLDYKDLAARTFDLDTLTPEQVRAAVIEIRAAKFPDWQTVGTAGSFFKNPIIPTEHYEQLRIQYPELPGWLVSDTQTKVPLGWILDKVCGVRGAQVGAVGSFKGQALVIVADPGATSAEIQAYANKLAALVEEKTAITIEWEVTLL